MNCDLHTHTTHSDGSYTTEELARLSKEKNLIIALTDHNTTSGIPSFLEAAERLGVTAVAGCELSTVYEGREFHLIGLFIPPEHYETVENLCVEYHKLKEKSNIDLIDKLCAMGYELDYSEISRQNLNGRINRAHIAAALVKGGYVGSIPEAFDRLLDEKCGIYLPPKRFPLCDAIRFLRGISVVPILAHPLKEIDEAKLEEMLPELVSAGLIAIETMHSSYSNEQIKNSKALANKYGLLESGGSDFHGSIKPGVELGTGKGNLDISDSIYQKLLDAKNKMKKD